MGDFTNQEYYWNNQAQVPMQQSFYEQDYSQLGAEQLEFKSNEEYSGQSFSQYPQAQFYNPNDYQLQNDAQDELLEEPPLLEELEIYPDRILEKVLAVLNPFRGHSLADDVEYLTKDPDLAGPVFFGLALALLLLLAGKQSFSYIYGFSMISIVFMYCLLSLMTSVEKVFTFSTVASILGYCIIPIVALSLLGVFFRLSGPVGIILAGVAVFWSSFSASRLFIAVSGDKQQQPLIMYPSALVYGVFVLLVLF